MLRYNADPFLESRYKDDALQTACLKGAAEIFEYLVDHIAYTPERVASAFELLGRLRFGPVEGDGVSSRSRLVQNSKLK